MRDLVLLLAVAVLYTLALGGRTLVRRYWDLGRWLGRPYAALLTRWIGWSLVLAVLLGLEVVQAFLVGFQGLSLSDSPASLWVFPVGLLALVEVHRATRDVLEASWVVTCSRLEGIFTPAKAAPLVKDLRQMAFSELWGAPMGVLPEKVGVWATLGRMRVLVALLASQDPRSHALAWGVLQLQSARVKGDPAWPRWEGFLEAVKTEEPARMGRLYQLRALTAWRQPEEHLVYDGFMEALQWMEKAPSSGRNA